MFFSNLATHGRSKGEELHTSARPSPVFVRDDIINYGGLSKSCTNQKMYGGGG